MENPKTEEEILYKKVLYFLKDKGYLNQAQQEHMFVVVGLIEEFSTVYATAKTQKLENGLKEAIERLEIINRAHGIINLDKQIESLKRNLFP